MAASARDIAFVGECMVELAAVGAAGQVRLGHGGDTFNSAIYAARLLGAGRAQYVTRLGVDPFSDGLVAAMADAGLDTSWIQRVAGSLPAVYAITLDGAERRFHYWREAAPVRQMLAEPEPRLETHLAGCRAVAASGISLAVLGDAGRARLLACAARAGGFSYCVNHRPVLWPDADTARTWHERALAVATHAFVSDEELAMLWGGADGSARLAGLTQGDLAVTAGASGCTVWQAGKEAAQVSGVPVTPVDTTAAGDSFAARYLVGRLGGETPATAAAHACTLAAEVVRHHGAIIPAEAMPAGIAPAAG